MTVAKRVIGITDKPKEVYVEFNNKWMVCKELIEKLVSDKTIKWSETVLEDAKKLQIRFGKLVKILERLTLRPGETSELPNLAAKLVKLEAEHNECIEWAKKNKVELSVWKKAEKTNEGAPPKKRQRKPPKTSTM